MIAALILAATLSSEGLGTFFEWPLWETNGLPTEIPSRATLGSDDLREMRYTSNLVANAYATMEGAYERAYYAFCTDTNNWDVSYFGPREPRGFLRGALRKAAWDYPTNRVIHTRRFIEADNLFAMTREIPYFRREHSFRHIGRYQAAFQASLWTERDGSGFSEHPDFLGSQFNVMWSSSVFGSAFLPSFDWRESFSGDYRAYAPSLVALYIDKIFVLTNDAYQSYFDRGQNRFIEEAFSEVDYPYVTEDSPYYGKLDAPTLWDNKYTFATLITNAYDIPLALSITNLTRRIITSRGVTNSFLSAYNQMLGVMDMTFERGVLHPNDAVSNFWHESSLTVDAEAAGSVSLDGAGRFSFEGEITWGEAVRTNAMASYVTQEAGEILRVNRTSTGVGAGLSSLATNYVMRLSECPAWLALPFPEEGDEESAIHISLTVSDYMVNIWWGLPTGDSGGTLYNPVPTNRLEVFGGVSIARNYDYRRSFKQTLPAPVYFPPSVQARSTGRVEEFDLAVFSSIATASLPFDAPPEEGSIWESSMISKWDSNFRSYWKLNTTAQSSWSSATNSVLTTAFGGLREKMDSLARGFYGVDYTDPAAMIPIPDGELNNLKNHFSVTGGTYQVFAERDLPFRLTPHDNGDGAIRISEWYVYDLEWNPITADFPIIWLVFNLETNIDDYEVQIRDRDEFGANGKMAIRTRNKWKWKALRREE